MPISDPIPCRKERAKNYRKEAEETRMLAYRKSEPEARLALLQVSADYLNMAALSERPERE